MAKDRIAFFCSDCGFESPKWVGKCPNCGAWNTFVEERVVRTKGGKSLLPEAKLETKPIRLSEIKAGEEERILMPSGELNRVLGGGLVQGSIILIGGEPGIGKSTLVLQNVIRIRSRKVLYVSGEESAQQLKMRADRLGADGGECFIVCETSLEKIFQHIKNSEPGIVGLYSDHCVRQFGVGGWQCGTSEGMRCIVAEIRQREWHSGCVDRPYKQRGQHSRP